MIEYLTVEDLLALAEDLRVPNGYDLDAPEDDAYDLVIAMSTGSRTYREAAVELAAWARVTSNG
ncbi:MULTISPECIES: hypothetical protein [Amycolatopsis]|uniref:Uncharacterized protein n=1 Tax=Amycolatopsis japonica TaxID=208439 RepID=A0A075UN97_9PSEU|nr:MULTISPECIES: hypothetical protein [Amycolatopsis]AIG73886.1 Hypothetical protein AJAP_04820 [Amycolatopsis japonica]OKJ97301.1 hypothetical protein AMK34_09805 [Amycolatopsis sp. CB00013]